MKPLFFLFSACYALGRRTLEPPSPAQEDKVIVFERGDLIFVMNLHPCPETRVGLVFFSFAAFFGGFWLVLVGLVFVFMFGFLVSLCFFSFGWLFVVSFGFGFKAGLNLLCIIAVGRLLSAKLSGFLR